MSFKISFISFKRWRKFSRSRHKSDLKCPLWVDPVCSSWHSGSDSTFAAELALRVPLVDTLKNVWFMSQLTDCKLYLRDRPETKQGKLIINAAIKIYE